MSRAGLLFIPLLISCLRPTPHSAPAFDCSDPTRETLPWSKPAPVLSKPGNLTVLVRFRRQLDLRQVALSWASHPMPRREQSKCIGSALESVASEQKELVPLLEQLFDRKIVSAWSSLRIENALIVTGTEKMIEPISADPRVASVQPIESQQPAEHRDRPAGSPPGSRAIDWAARAIKADELWKVGLTGKGVVVGIIDAGASAEHEQLTASFRGGANSWFDPVHRTPAPRDVQVGHGTGVLSAAVGQPTKQSRGIASGSKWIAAVGREPGKFNLALFLLAADWMLRVGRPDVVVLPLRQVDTQCDESLKRSVNALRAAGMVLVFAAGNDGPRSGTDVSPANYDDLFPGGQPALSVGATGPTNEVSALSSRGPNRCGRSLFPQVVAPGEHLLVAFPLSRNSYRVADGTSYAAGIVAGAAALLVEAFPDVSAQQIESALRETARDLGTPGPDPAFGHGLIDLVAALKYLEKEWGRTQH